MVSRLKHWAKLASDTNYRRVRNEAIRLVHLPNHTPATTVLKGHNIQILDGKSFLYTKGEIFDQEIYRFKTDNPSPLIIDAGANIGLSVIYFKKSHPGSRIIAFEPDPLIFTTLAENCRSFGLTDVVLVNKGLWKQEGKVNFVRDGSEAGHISNNGADPSQLISIDAVTLRGYLGQRIDFLKLDIEGAETEVLMSCADKLINVDRIFVEYHSFPNRPQTLHVLLKLLSDAGFRTQIKPVSICPFPFIERPLYFGMDLQLNIYGYRE